MATFTYKTKNPHNGFIEDRIIKVTEEDVKLNTIDDFINEIELKIKTTLKDEDNCFDKIELYNEYKEHFNMFVETKQFSSENLICSILRKRLSEYIREFNISFPARDTFQHILDEKKAQFKPVELFCWKVIKNNNIPFVIENRDAVLQWFSDKLETSLSKLKEQQRNAMNKWGKQIVKCECGKEYTMYNKRCHIVTKHHLNHINGTSDDTKEVIVKEDFVTKFMKDFILTNEKNDYTTSEDIQKWIDENNLKISMIKFGTEITAYCETHSLQHILKKDKKIDGKAKKVWFGIKPK